MSTRRQAVKTVTYISPLEPLYVPEGQDKHTEERVAPVASVARVVRDGVRAAAEPPSREPRGLTWSTDPDTLGAAQAACAHLAASRWICGAAQDPTRPILPPMPLRLPHTGRRRGTPIQPALRSDSRALHCPQPTPRAHSRPRHFGPNASLIHSAR